VSLLVFAPVVFAVAGAVGTYRAMFADDVSVLHNATAVATRAGELVYESYTTKQLPAVFVTWGAVATALYVFLCVLYILVKFSCICRECSAMIDESDAESKSAVADALQQLRSARGRREHVIDLDNLSSLDQIAALRSEYDRSRHDSGQHL